MVAILMENGIYEYAHELMGEFLMTLQLTRSVGGFWTLYGQHGVQRTEEVQRILARTGKSSLRSKIGGALFGRGKQESQAPVVEPE